MRLPVVIANPPNRDNLTTRTAIPAAPANRDNRTPNPAAASANPAGGTANHPGAGPAAHRTVTPPAGRGPEPPPWHNPSWQPPPTHGGQPAWQPGWAPQHGHPAPPRQRSNAGVAMAALIVVALIGVIGIIGLVATAGSGSSRTAEPGYERYSPTQPASTTPGPTTPPPSATADRTPRPSTSAPSVEPRPVHRLADNPIFRGGLGLPAVDCRLPRFSADPATQAVFYRAAIGCLDEVWLPTLRAAGLPARSPLLEVPMGPFDTPCGNKAAVAAANYCEGTIYMPPRYFDEIEQLPANQPTLYLGVLAHEYGHHVQELAGVMDAAWERRYEAGVSSPSGLDVSRRNELLATCFGGMFYASTAGRGSITRAMLDATARDQARRGDYPETGQPRDHGTPANNGAWFGQGVRLNQTSQCNTWEAQSDSVG